MTLYLSPLSTDMSEPVLNYAIIKQTNRSIYLLTYLLCDERNRSTGIMDVLCCVLSVYHISQITVSGGH